MGAEARPGPGGGSGGGGELSLHVPHASALSPLPCERSPRELKARRQKEQKAAAVECCGYSSRGCSLRTVSPPAMWRAENTPRPLPATSRTSSAILPRGVNKLNERAPKSDDDDESGSIQCMHVPQALLAAAMASALPLPPRHSALGSNSDALDPDSVTQASDARQ